MFGMGYHANTSTFANLSTSRRHGREPRQGTGGNEMSRCQTTIAIETVSKKPG